MNNWIILVTILYIGCHSAVSESNMYNGSGDGSGDGETTVPSTSTFVPSTGTVPAGVDEQVTMILTGVNQTYFEEELEDDFRVSISTYVQMFCTENPVECEATAYVVKQVESEAFGQLPEDDMTIYLPLDDGIFEKKVINNVKEIYQYKMKQESVVIGPENVIITETTEVEENLNVLYYVNAVSNGETVVIPQSTVESTLDVYESNITEDLGGVEFDYVPDSTEGGDGGDDLEPWVIALICMGAVTVVGGLGYFVYKQQDGKKKKKKSSAYLDNYSRENTNNSSNSNLYNSINPTQRTSYGSGSAAYKYNNPTYDRSDNRNTVYDDVDLESNSSGVQRTSL